MCELCDVCRYVLVKVLHSSTIVNALVQTQGPWGNGYSCMTLSPHASNMIITIMMSNHNFEPDQYDLNHHDNDVELQLSNYLAEDFL